MKKLVYLSIAIAVGVAAASCQKVELTPSENTEVSTFALNASIEQTKTTINGLEVNWEDNDVLYLVTTDGTWGKPYKEDNAGATIAEYTYSAGTFASEATIADGTYTFNALYGSASQKSYHRGASTTYNLQSTQSQDCSNPTGHLKLNDALVGTFDATVPMAKPASVSMSHIFAIMRVDVKNATGADVELKSFEMSAAGATLAGIFTVNFAKTPIDVTEKSDQSSSSIKVNLTNGTVASGASLPVYFVMAPLANYSGDVTFTVTDADNKVYTKTVALSNITFSAGSLNTTPYKITEGVAPTYYTWDLSVNSTSEATAEKIAWTNDVADMVCTPGKDGTAANNYYPGTEGKTYSSTRFYTNSTLSITPKTGKSLTYYVFEATSEGYATALANSTWTNAKVYAVGTTVTVIATDPSLAVSAVIGATCGFTKVECHTDAPVFAPIISANPTSINVPAAGDVCTINYSIVFPVDGKSISATSDQDWVNSFDYSTTGEISFVVDANTGDARTATVTLSYEGADDVTVLVTQAASGSASKKTVTYTVTSTSAVSASGDAPSGSSSTYSSTYSTAKQLTSGNSMTLTLSGYKGMIVKGLTLSMKSNSSKGAGYLSVKAGTTTLSSIGSSSSGVNFNNASWHGAWSTSYVYVTPTLSNTAYTVQNGEDIVIVIGATANSLYCQSFTIEYVADPSYVHVAEKLDAPVVSCTAQTETSLTFSWDAVANASGYQVSTDGGSTYGSTLTTTSYTWTGLSASTTKTLYVKAIGDNSNYTHSDAATASGTTTAGSGSGENPGVTTVSLDETEIKALGKLAYTDLKTINDGEVTWTVYAYKDNASRPWLQLKKDSGVYVKISAPSAIKEVRLTITSATNSSGGLEDISKHDAYLSSGTISLKSADAIGNTTTNDVVSCTGDAISNNNVTLVPIESYNDLYLKVSAGARIWGLEVDY